MPRLVRGLRAAAVALGLALVVTLLLPAGVSSAAASCAPTSVYPPVPGTCGPSPSVAGEVAGPVSPASGNAGAGASGSGSTGMLGETGVRVLEICAVGLLLLVSGVATTARGHYRGRHARA